MSYIVIGLAILWGILWAIVTFFEWLGKTSKQVKVRMAVDTSKTIIERNQDIIQDWLGRIYDDSWPYYIENKVSDCIEEIAKREGQPELAPQYREWLSVWQNREGIPSEYLELKDYLKEIFQARLSEKRAIAKSQQEAREQETKSVTEQMGLAIFERHKDLVDKFLEIAERKVSIIDDYGDENWKVLPEEIFACVKKIAEKENLQFDWLKYIKAKRRGSFHFSSEVLPDEYEWLESKLEEVFKNHHKIQSEKPAIHDEVDGLSGVDFEVWIAKLLKGHGYEDVRGTPATGDQGADLIAKKDGKTIIIQAKRYKGTVGNKAVQEVISAVGFYGGDEGWVVTSSTFTPSAKALAHKMNVRLVDGNSLKNFDAFIERGV